MLPNAALMSRPACNEDCLPNECRMLRNPQLAVQDRYFQNDERQPTVQLLSNDCRRLCSCLVMRFLHSL